jgi:hypothetical protein
MFRRGAFLRRSTERVYSESLTPRPSRWTTIRRNRQAPTQEDRDMKRIAVLYPAVALLAFGTGQAFAHPTHTAASTKVTVVMHDPGCHWFSVGGAFKTKLAVKGPAKLQNVDEAALKIVGAGAARRVAVGKTVLLGKGTYAITMVGQAPDDNHLRLVVR